MAAAQVEDVTSIDFAEPVHRGANPGLVIEVIVRVEPQGGGVAEALGPALGLMIVEEAFFDETVCSEHDGTPSVDLGDYGRSGR